jgi:hypothetical protein
MTPEAAEITYYLSKERVRIEKLEPKEVKQIPVCEKLLWRKYRNAVWKITEKQNLRKLPHFKDRGFTNYHLDHKVSIWYGYKHKLDPYLIGGIDNLEFIPYQQNMKKGIKSNFKGAKCLQSVIFV